MYQFSTQEIAGLQVAQTVAKGGTTHKKTYAAAGVTPATQDTLNVYVSGSFRFDCGAFTQTLAAGQTSLDLTIEEYTAGEICEETVLSAWGMRFCVSSKKPWEREQFTLGAGQTLTLTKDSLLVLVSGTVGVSGSAMAPVSYRYAPKGCVVTPVSFPAQAIVCRLQ